MDVSNKALAITLKRKRKKVAKWGTPKKYLKKINNNYNNQKIKCRSWVEGNS